MRIARGNFFSQCLIVLISLGLLFSSYVISRSQTKSIENTPPSSEITNRRLSYAQYAALIGGIRTPQSIVAPFESRPAWTGFAGFFDHHWEKYYKKQLAPMREWAAKELAAPISSGLAVLYPFCGADFVNACTLFPSANNYIMIALEPIGEIPDFQAMSEDDFNSFFADLKQSLHDLLSIDYFVSAHMHTAMESRELNGVLPIILFFMAREKARILDVEDWFMEPDGTVQKVPAPGKNKPGAGGFIPGVRIVFESAGPKDNKPQTLYYFRLNLYNSAFRRNSHFITFLEGFGPFISFMKSASYVMFDPHVSIFRQFVLDQSRYIVQEDSGIPFKYFDPSVWTMQFYGAYSEPISIFKHDYQEDLAGIYKTGTGIKPLPFGFGYHFEAGTANLLLATRK